VGPSADKPAPALAPQRTLLALETRTLFDGAGAIAAVQAPDADHQAHDAAQDTGHADTPAAASLADGALDAAPATQRELLIVDTAVSGWQDIVAAVRPGVEVVVLDPARNALEQIAERVRSGDRIDTLHLVSHGAAGALVLGGQTLDLAGLPGEAARLADIGAGLDVDADILLYGCDIGQGANGDAFLAALAQATGADIAASDDATGAAARGGDWVLERHIGVVQGQVIEASAFAGLLDAPTVTNAATGMTVIEPSALNGAGVSSATLSGWVIGDDGIDATDVTVDVTVADAAKGTLTDPSAGGVMIAGGFRLVGPPATVQAWVNQLVFTAADVELGNSAATTSITVSVTDGELLTPLTASKTLNVTITPSNDPVLVADGTQAVTEGSSGTAINATTALAAVDPEVAAGTQSTVQVVYRLTSLPTYGYLTLNGARVGVGSIFTHANVANGNLVYVHTATGADQNTTDSFGVSVNDGATPQASSDTATVSLTITPVNQQPVVNGNGAGSGAVYEGQPREATSGGVPQSIVGNFITASGGGDPGDTTLTVRLTSLPTHGTLYFNGSVNINGVLQVINRAITNTDIADGFVFAYADRSNLTYSNDGIDPAPDDAFDIEVTDGGGGLGPGSALSRTATVNLDVRPVNDDPEWNAASTLTATVTPDGPDAIASNTDDFRVTLTPAMLEATDADSADTQLSFVVTQLPASGLLLLNNQQLLANSTFSMDDVRAGRVQYVQTTQRFDVNPTDIFRFQVRDNALSLHWDGSGEDFERTGGVYDGNGAADPLTSFLFTVNLVQSTNPGYTGPGGTVQPPPAPSTALTTNYVGTDPNTGTPISTLAEGGTVVLTNAMLNYSATGATSEQVVYSIQSFGGVASGWNGVLQKNGVTLGLYGNFTQDDIDNGRIRFVHNGGEDFDSFVTFQISAGGTSGGLPLVADNVVFHFYIAPVNDNPTANGSSTLSISEGATVAITTGQLSFADADDATSESYLENDPAIADNIQDNFAQNHGAFGADPLRFRIVTLPTHGTLQWDSTGSGTWTDITAADVSGQTLFDASIITGASGTTRLRYVNDGLEAASDSFQVVSHDRRGAESGTATVSLVVTNVNDAPEIASDPTQPDPDASGRSPNNIGGAAANEPLTIVEEGGFTQLTSAMLQAYDPDSSSQQVQYRVTTAPAQGRMAYSTDGITFLTIGVGSSFSQAEIAAGRIYYLHDGSEPVSGGYPGTPDDKFVFTLADGDKEQAGNEFWIYVNPTNDAPTVNGPGSPVRLDSQTGTLNPIPGVSIADPDLVSVLPAETDFVQVTVRVLQQNGTPFASGDYAGLTLEVAASGATIDGDHDGNADYLVLRGTRSQVNTALAGLAVTFDTDRDAVYLVQIIADDRLRDGSGVLIDQDGVAGGVQPSGNGGPLNQPATPPGATSPAVATEYDWYDDAAPSAGAITGNLSYRNVTVWASHTNDPQTLTVPGAQTPTEDTAFVFSQGAGNRILIADPESQAFGLSVKLTLTVASGTLTVDDMAGIVVTGSGTGTVVITGSVANIQARLDAGFSYTGNAQYNGTDTLTVTLDEDAAAVGGDVGSASVKNANVVDTVNLDIIAVNDAPSVTMPAGPIPVNTNTPVAISGVSVGDPADFSGNSAGVQAGETDFVQVTVRLLTAGGVPVTDYTGVTFAVAGGATIDAAWDGLDNPLVLRGTLADVNTSLAGLTLELSGNRDLGYQIQVLVDDRLRDASGVLVGDADGGASNQEPGLPAVPGTDSFATDPINTTTAAATGTYNIVASTVDIFASSSNDAPVNTLPVGLSFAEDSTNNAVRGAGNTYITVGDTDDFGANLTVVLTATGGTMSIGSHAGVSGDGVTNQTTITLVGNKADLNTVLQSLTFTPTAQLHGAAGVANIRVATTDTALAGSGSNQTDTDDLAITLTAVNDQPSASSNATIPAFTEDGSNPAGVVINTLSFGYSDGTDDRSGITNATTGIAGDNTATAFSYIAIVGSTNYTAGQGTWQISNGSGGWIDIPTSGLTTSAALLFPSSREIRFVPAANFHGTPGTLTVRLADNSTNLDGNVSTTAAQTRNLTSVGGTGGTGSWNTTSRTIGTTVANVNDRPTGSTTVLPATTEDNANPAGATVATLGFGYSDVTDNQGATGANVTGGGNAATAFGGIAIVGNAANAATEGVWQYNVGGGWITIAAGGPSDSTALLLPTTANLRFLPNVADFNGTPGGLSVYVSDTAVAFNASSDISGALGSTSQWSASVALNTSVTARNDAPTTNATASNPTAVENGSTGSGLSVDPVLLLNSGVTVADLDLSSTAGLAAGVFGAGTITVSLTDNYRSGDVLFVNSALPAGVLVSGGSAGALTITLDNDTTIAEVQSILEAIAYQSTSDDPTLNDTDTDRNYRIVLSDGNNVQAGGNAGGASALSATAIDGVITITPANDAPVADLNGAGGGVNHAVTWTEAANAAHTPVAIVPAATLADVDNTNLVQMTLTVSGVLDGNNEVLNIGGTAFQLGTTVANVDVGNYLVSYVAGAGGGSFTIVPDGSGFAALSGFEALLRGVSYVNNTDHPSDGDRSVQVQVRDAGYDNGAGVGGELDGNTPTVTLNVDPVNDQSTLSGLTAAVFYENDLNSVAAVLDGDVTLTDADSADYAGGSLTVSGLVAGQDTVSLPASAAAVLGNVQRNGANVEYYDGGGWIVIGTHSGGAGNDFVVSFNASATRAMVERVIENLTFANASHQPTTARTLTLAVNDGDGGTVQSGTLGVTIRLDNDAPELSATVLGGTYTEQNATPLAFVGGTIAVSDPDGVANFFAGGAGSLTVSLDGYVSGDTLSVLHQGNGGGQIGVSGNTVSYGGVSFATLSGGNGSDLVVTFNSTTATPAAVQALLGRLRYASTSDDPTVSGTDTSRAFTVTLNDGANTKDPSSSTTALTATLNGSILLTAVNDAPVITPAVGNAAYTENAGATVVDNTVTLTDADDTQISGGTVTISAGWLASDVLAVTNTGSITGSYDSTTGVLTLTGTDSLANYQTVLRSLTYLNTGDDPTANTANPTRTLTYSLTDANSDGAGAAIGTATKTVAITASTDVPVMSAGGSLSYAEGQSAQIIDAGVSVLSDADDTQMASATVQITAGLTAGDALSVAGTAIGNLIAGTNITVTSYNSVTGVLTLTGTDTLANYQAVLRTVSYASSSEDPTASAANRTITWRVTDANSDATGAGSSVAVTSTVNLTAGTDAPVITPAIGNAAYTENAGATVVDNTVTLTDADDTQISGGTVTISAGWLASDVLAVTNTGSITGSYDAATGVLTLSGTDSLANYQTVLRSLTYLNTGDDPTANTANPTRTLTYSLTDANSDGAGAAIGTATKTIAITATTDVPVMSAGGNLSYAEGQSAQVIDAGVSVVSDADDTQMASATVQITAGLTAGDALSVAGTAIGNLIAGTNITVTSYNSGTGVLTLTGTDSLANYQAVLRTVSYASSSEDPTSSAASRTITWRVTDANSDATGAGNSVAVTSTVNLAAGTDAPVITPAVGNAAYTENAGATVVDNTVTLTDADDTQISGGTVTISAGWLASDVLAVTNTGSITSSYDAATGVLTLSGTDSLANYQTVLRSLTYLNTGDDPTANTANPTRTLTYSLTDANSDGAGAAIGTATKTIAITATTDVPVMSAGGNLSYAEGQSAQIIDAGVSVVSDADDTQMASATVQITAGLTAGDALSVAGTAIGNLIAGTNITVTSYNSGTGVLTLTGTDSLPNYQAVLRSVSYASASPDPTAISASRTITWRVTDADSDATGAGISVAVTSTIAIADSNDAPVLTPAGGNAAYIENAAATVVDNTITVTDADDTQISGGTVTISAGWLASDVLAVTDTGAITGSYDAATGVLTLTGTDSLANYQTVLRSLTYLNTGDDPTNNTANPTRTLTYSLTDANAHGSGAAIGTATKTVAVTATTDVPLMSAGGNLAYAENQPAQILDAGVSVVSDADDTQIASATVQIGAGLADGDVLAVSGTAIGQIVAGTGITVAGYDAVTGTLTLTGTDSLAHYQAVLRTVTYASTSENPTAASNTRSVSWRVTDADSDAAGTGASVAVTSAILLTGSNDLPVANPDTGTVEEKGLLTVNAAQGVILSGAVPGGVDADPDGDTLAVIGVRAGTAASVGDVGTGHVGTPLLGTYGSLTLHADGRYTYSADQAAAAALAVGATVDDVFSYAIEDGHGGMAFTTLTITVTGSNDEPVAQPDTHFAVAGEGPAIGNVLQDQAHGSFADHADTDTDGDTLAVVDTGTRSGLYGSLVMEADGRYTYTLDAANADVQALVSGQTLTETFTYRASDGHGGTASSTLTITVMGRNDAPAGEDRAITLQEDSSVTVRAEDFGFADPDTSGSGSQFAAVRVDVLPVLGTLRLDGVPVVAGQLIAKADLDAGKLRYAPPADMAGNAFASLRFSVQDGLGALDPVPNTLTIHVEPVSDAPRLVAQDADGSATAPGLPIALSITVEPTDTNAPGLETLGSLTLTGLPDGSVLGNAAGDRIVVAGGKATLSPAQLAGLHVTLPTSQQTDFDVTVTASSSDHGAAPAFSTATLHIKAPLPQDASAPPPSATAAESTPSLLGTIQGAGDGVLGTRGGLLGTDPPSIWEGVGRSDRVTNLPILQQAVVYVEVTVGQAQSERLRKDARMDGTDVQLVQPGEFAARSIGAGLGMDHAVYVQHAVHDAEQERMALQDRTLGREGRVSLSADGLLTDPSLFSLRHPSPFLMPDAIKAAVLDQPERGAPAFTEQLRRAAQTTQHPSVRPSNSRPT
jgi:VCBS repeat-containing protein